MQPDGRVSNSFPAQWGNDEIGDLGRRFGQLLGRVHEYTEYLRTLASKLSHELRTPLALVKSSLDNFEQDPDPKYLQRARQGNERLSSILTAMSEATRVEEAIRSSDQEEIDLVAFVKEYTDHYAGSVEQQFECNSASDAIRIQGSVDLLAQLLDKLFDNAIDFCTSGSVISVDVQQEQGYGCISITNEGPLLPAAMGEQLFDSMVSIRADKGDSTHLGLGLTIVRLVAEFHGGDVTARNLEDGSGVEFLVRISA
jgi:two-component system sensor histidine kinase ChvG